MNRYSPLRYPGGKGKLAGYLTELLEMNGLVGGHYVEPFAGGAAVALDLLFSGVVAHIHINDIDPFVASFWRAATQETEDFVGLIERTEVTIESWLAAREVKRNYRQYSVIEVGFATFFLSRTNRSGILNGGVIGGLRQSGTWKIDCRFNKDDLISRVLRLGFFRSRISITSVDARDLLAGRAGALPCNAFYYIDPPYYNKGAYLYRNHFSDADHVSLAECISVLAQSGWIVSYDNVPRIAEIYSNYEQEEFSVDYTARAYAKGSEIMVFAPGLRRPNRIYCSQREKRLLEA